MWLQQVHGCEVIDSMAHYEGVAADGCMTVEPNQVCAILTADCLPVLLCDHNATVVAAVHAGWRGLYSGVIQRAVAQMGVTPDSIMAWLGPAISSQYYAVNEDFRNQFLQQSSVYSEAFVFNKQWHADLYMIARIQLNQSMVQDVYGGEFCTYKDEQRFYSYRRAGHTGLAAGRQASVIWLED